MTVMVPCENADRAGLRRVIGEEDVKQGARRPSRRREPDAEELEPALQAQPREDQDGRRLRARRGGPQPRHPGDREGPLHRREADVHPGEEDPRLRADVRARDGRGRARRGTSRSSSPTRTRAATARPRPPSSPTLSVVGIVPAGGSGERLGADRPQGVRRSCRQAPARMEPRGPRPASASASWWPCRPASRSIARPRPRRGDAARLRFGTRWLPRRRPTVAVVHDAARPLVTRELVERCLAGSTASTARSRRRP